MLSIQVSMVTGIPISVAIGVYRSMSTSEVKSDTNRA